MKAAILTIGDEILNGSTVDTNAVFMAEKTIQEGLEIAAILSVSDTKHGIENGLNFVLQNADVVFITGGLGPTKDDITLKTLASYVSQKLKFNQQIFDKINAMLSARRQKVVEIEKNRCLFPEKAILLNNKKGTAPGMWIEHKGKLIVSMPGVPLEMKQIFVDEVLPKILKTYQLRPIINKYILTAGIWESILAKKIEIVENALPKEISIAYLPKLGQVKLRITGKNTTEEAVQKIVDDIATRIKAFVYSFNPKDTLEKVVGQMLKERKKTLTLAESCTGGKIVSKLISVAGSSAYIKASIVSYCNEQKNALLKVKKSTLKKYGAVSEQTVVEMAQGLLQLITADYCIAISGIAGPTGGSEDKPVGTVWIAVANNKKIISKRFSFWTHRAENIELSSVAALKLLLEFMKSEEGK